MKSIILGFYSAAFVCFSASATGTIAWYQYVSNTGLDFRGTTVGNFENLQIGIASKIRLDNYRKHELLEEDVQLVEKYGTYDRKGNLLDLDDPRAYYVYWARGGMKADAINYVSRMNGYATSRLGPVTTGKYSREDDEFILHNGPVNGLNYVPGTDNYDLSRDEVEKKRYSRLVFVFRVGDYTAGDTGKPDVPIYLAVDNVQTGRVDARNSLRFYVQNELVGGDKYLVAPMYEKDGSVDVGGPLDLSTDGYYDIYKKDGEDYELAYGEFEEGPYYKPVTEGDLNEYSKKELSTFDSNHNPESMIIDMERSKPFKSEFFGAGKLMGNDRTQVATTNEEMFNYAFFDLTIYVEGWDPSVIDQANLTEFNLDLTFSAGI